MVKTLYGEARGEHKTGKRAVAHVIRNRLESSQWPNDSVSAVVLQPYQFSVWNPVTIGAQPNSNFRMTQNFDDTAKGYDDIEKICKDVLEGRDPDPTNGADHYHTSTIRPDWSQTLKDAGYKVKTIGSHVFYYHPDRPDRIVS